MAEKTETKVEPPDLEIMRTPRNMDLEITSRCNLM